MCNKVLNIYMSFQCFILFYLHFILFYFLVLFCLINFRTLCLHYQSAISRHYFTDGYHRLSYYRMSFTLRHNRWYPSIGSRVLRLEHADEFFPCENMPSADVPQNSCTIYLLYHIFYTRNGHPAYCYTGTAENVLTINNTTK